MQGQGDGVGSEGENEWGHGKRGVILEDPKIRK